MINLIFLNLFQYHFFLKFYYTYHVKILLYLLEEIRHGVLCIMPKFSTFMAGKKLLKKQMAIF